MDSLRDSTDPTVSWWHDYYEPELKLGPTETPVIANKCSSGREPTTDADVVDRGPYALPLYVGRCFRHSGWQAFRLRVATAYVAAYGAGQSVSRFCQCGEGMWILRGTKDSTAFKSVPDLCRSRWCKVCYGARTARLRARLAEELDDNPVRFVTLTLKHNDDNLKSCLDRLYGSFRRLRSKAIWKKRVTGGVAFLEVGRGKNSRQWHPHIHCLVQGRYLPQAELRQTWLSITGDSYNCDVKLVRDRRQVLAYVAKYTSKSNGMDPSATDADLTEIIRTLRGRRTVIPFGSWRHFRLLRQEPSTEWELVGHVNEVLYRAQQGDDFMQSVFDAMQFTSDSEDGIFHVYDSAIPPT